MRRQPVLVARGLTYRYGAEEAVRALDLEVAPGDVLGLVGPNGAGKTTTIRLLLGLLRPAAGSVEAFGRVLDATRVEFLRQVGALVETPALYAHLTGEENLLLEGRVRGVPNSAIRAALRRAGLGAAAGKLVRAYSLGMQQRLALAMALLHAPRLVVLDEPSNGLDPEGIAELRERLVALAAEGAALLVSSHLLGELEQVATRVAVLRQGTLAFQGPIDELRRRAGNRLRVGCAEPGVARRHLEEAGLGPAEEDGGHLLLPPPADSPAGWTESGVARVNALLVARGTAVHDLGIASASLEVAYLRLVGAGKDS